MLVLSANFRQLFAYDEIYDYPLDYFVINFAYINKDYSKRPYQDN